jgi:hypothetical protein
MEASSVGKHEYRGQRKMSQVLGACGLLDFTMLGLFWLGGHFRTYEAFI